MITYRKGNAANPPERPAIIVHVVNDSGKWGRGFTASLDKTWGTRPRATYLHAFATGLQLGDCGFAALTANLRIAHLCAMQGVRSKRNPIPLRLDALEQALIWLAADLKWDEPDVPPIIMPRIGTGLAGGTWGLVEPFVSRELGKWSVIVCDLEMA